MSHFDPSVPAVETRELTKEFKKTSGQSFTAVDAVDLSIRQGEIFCIVGPDGAGKTTSIRMMCGVLPPTSGSTRILGLDVRKDRKAVKHHIGYLSQRFSLYADLTVEENIDFFAEIHGEKNFAARKQELLDMTRLGRFTDRLAGQLSGGMKQKLALACTLIHEPDVIFLDEPTTGVDPVSRRDFWRILSSLLKDGMSIVVSTPYLDEAERSTRVALMDKGRIVRCDTPEAIRSTFPYAVFEIAADDVRELGARLRGRVGEERVHVFGDRLHVLIEPTNGDNDFPADIAKEFTIATASIRKLTPSLEDVFIQQTEQAEANHETH